MPRIIIKWFAIAVGVLPLVLGPISCGRSGLPSSSGALDSSAPPADSDGGLSKGDHPATDANDARVSCPAGLDLSFGQQGRYQGSGTPVVAAVLPRADGGLLAVGEAPRANDHLELPAVWAVAGILGDGRADPSFGVGGTAMVHVLPDGDGVVQAGALQSDGKVVIAGVVHPSGGTDQGTLARLNHDGSLDAGFGTGGIATLPVAGAVPAGVAVAPDGSLLVAGTVRIPVGDVCCDGNVVVAKYDPLGRLDPSFGSNGVVKTAVGVAEGDDYASAILSLPDGHVVVAGFAYVAAGEGGAAQQEAMLLRYTAAGTLDSTFGADGVVLFRDYGRAQGLAVQGEGNLLISLSHGGSSRAVVVGRTTAVGASDLTFGDEGFARVDVPSGDAATGGVLASSVFSLPDGSILVGGAAGDGTFFLAKLRTDGAADAAFGEGGLVRTSLVSAVAAVTPDGKAIVAGTSAPDGLGVLAVERYCL